MTNSLFTEDLETQMDDNIEQLRHEVRNLTLMLWAAAKSNGGELTIHDAEIQEYGSNAVLHRYHDAGNSCVVLTAK